MNKSQQTQISYIKEKEGEHGSWYQVWTTEKDKQDPSRNMMYSMSKQDVIHQVIEAKEKCTLVELIFDVNAKGYKTIKGVLPVNETTDEPTITREDVLEIVKPLPQKTHSKAPARGDIPKDKIMILSYVKDLIIADKVQLDKWGDITDAIYERLLNGKEIEPGKEAYVLSSAAVPNFASLSEEDPNEFNFTDEELSY